MDATKIKLYDNLKKYNKILFVFIFSVILYIVTAIYNNIFVDIMSLTSYLTWHIIFEFSGILVSFSIFTVTYFIYAESRSLKMLILGCVFLIMAILDAFHTLSYKGMADFFIANDTANRATTLWILSRLIGSLGFMIGISIPSNRISNIKKESFTTITIAIAIILFLLVTYFPSLFPTMYIEGIGLTNIKLILEYLVILIHISTFFMVLNEYRKINTTREYMFMIALVLLVFSEFAFTNYGSVYDAFNYIGHFYKVIAYMIFYKAIYIENVSAPYVEMKLTRNKLKEYSDNLNLLVQKRTMELEELNNVLVTDLEYAKEMQRCLLPKSMPQNSSVSFFAEFFPAERLSGDFYNVIKLDEDSFAVYVGDVSGHGVSAAMLTVFAIQNAIQLREKEGSSEEIIEPGFVLKTIYKSFNKTNINDEKYILMLYGIFNTKNKCFTYASAGINVSPYIIKKSGEVFEMDVKGFPICKFEDYIVPFYDNRNIQLESGDKILFYTDGLVEAKNKNGEIYGQPKMKNFLEKNYNLTSAELNTAIKSTLFKHIGNGEKLMDDITFVIMEVN